MKKSTHLFKVQEDNVYARGIDVTLGTPAERLVTDDKGTEIGLFAMHDRRRLRSGSGDAAPIFSGRPRADRLLSWQHRRRHPMAQAVSSDLWHTWNYHSRYGLEQPDPDYPFGLYLKALPMWTPGHADYIAHLGVSSGPSDISEKSRARLAWILVDQTGQRFTDEYPRFRS